MSVVGAKFSNNQNVQNSFFCPMFTAISELMSLQKDYIKFKYLEVVRMKSCPNKTSQASKFVLLSYCKNLIQQKLNKTFIK